MSLPVSQYEALLAEVRGLRRKAQRVQQLARPLIGDAGISHHYQNERLNEPLDYTMESLLLNRQRDRSNSPNYDRASTSGHLSSEEEYLMGGHSKSTAPMSVSSEPVARGASHPQIDSLYHGAWPNVERTSMWNSEPASLGTATQQQQQQRKDFNDGGPSCHADVSSVMSFASSSGGVPIDRVLCSPEQKWSSQQLEAKMDVVHSLLSMLGSQEHVDMGETLLALSTCPESCLAMRQSGCIPLLVQLVQSDKDHDTRKKASQALHNLINSQLDEKIRKREVRILKLLEHIRMYIECLKNNIEFEMETSGSTSTSQQSQEDYDKHPVQTIAHLMKLSFDEGHRQAICQLGGIHTIAHLVEIEHAMHGSAAPENHCILMRRYACMALTNLTFGDSGNKALLCSFRDFMRALVVQLLSPSDELRQVTASVLRNLSWRADSTSKEILREVGSVTGLMKSAMLKNKENTLRSILSALWNLSAHCTENKSEICAVEGALGFIVTMLTYKTPSKSLAIIENAGGILRNISSQIAVREDYREILRKHNCLQILLDQLKSPSLTIVSNACGTLWNLSAKNAQDQDALWQMGAPTMLRSLNHSKHKMIAMGSSAALKNLLGCRPQQNLMQKLDATALSLNLTELPTLGARKQKALMEDLDHTLSETYENIEKDSPVKSKPEKGVDMIGFIHSNPKLKSNCRSPDDLNNAFASLNLNEPSTSYASSDVKRKSRIPQSFGSSSLPYVPQATRRTNPAAFKPVGSKFSDNNFDDDTVEQPIDYSRKYTESSRTAKKTAISASATPSKENTAKSESDRLSSLVFAESGVKKDSDSFSIGYTETDLDQPTDYSLRYAEDDSDSDICSKISKQEYVQDTVKTYCTEGTPYETPFVFSTATSMSDLRNVGNNDEKPQLIDNDLQKNKEAKVKKEGSSHLKEEGDQRRVTNNVSSCVTIGRKGLAEMDDPLEIKNIDEKDHCSTEDISEIDNADVKPQKSEFSSGMMSPEKPVNYCEEGTPGYFSRVSSFGSGLDSIPANETVIKKEIKEGELNVSASSTQKMEKRNAEKTTSTSKIPNETKAVKFEQNVNYAEETPLMFSRSSSLASLDSIEQHSIHDDRSSVVSDFSRLTSGIVSPSELPDSPTQTVPPSPRPSKSKLEFPSTSKPPRHSIETKHPRSLQKPSVFEDNITKFKEESTPVQFSTATSLSSLTIDDHEDHENSESPAKTPDTKVLQQNSNSGLNVSDADKDDQTLEQQEKKDSEKETEKETSGSDDLNDDSEGDDDILAACISDGMQSNISMPTASSTPTKLPMSSFKYQPAKAQGASTGIPLMRRTPPGIPASTSHLMEDAPKAYFTEDTPAHLSRTGSNSNLSTLSIPNDNKSKSDFSDDSSNLSGENDNILEQCIQSAMPKSKKDIKAAAQQQTKLPSTSALPRRSLQPAKHHSVQMNAHLGESIPSSHPQGVHMRKPGEAPKAPQQYVIKERVFQKTDNVKQRENARQDAKPNKERNRRETSLPPSLSIRDEVENYAVEGSPCHFSVRSSLSDLTVDGSVAGLQPYSKNKSQNQTDSEKKNDNVAAGYNRKPPPTGNKHNAAQHSPPNLNRRESLSSLSSLASNEGDQALLEECIYSGMPTDKHEEALLNECINAGMPKSASGSRRDLNQPLDASSLRPVVQNSLGPFQRNDFTAKNQIPLTESGSRSKNVNVASVAGNTAVEFQPPASDQCPEMSTTAAGVKGGLEPNRSVQNGTAEKFNSSGLAETPQCSPQSVRHEDGRTGTPPVADTLPDRFSRSEENFFTDQTKSGSNKSIKQFLENSFETDLTYSNSDNCANIDNVFAKSCEDSGNMVDNRMLDPDAMIESLDRFTAELVSQASHLTKDKDSQLANQEKSKASNIENDNTWNEDTSPEVTFPSISGSAPNVITFGSDKDESNRLEFDNGNNNFDLVDGFVNRDDGQSNDFSSVNTSTMTESTLIAIEATKMATAFKIGAEMSQSITSLDLDSVRPPSQLNSLTNSAIGLEKGVPKSPKLGLRKKSLPGTILVKRALSNSIHHGSSLESLENHSLTNLDNPNPPSEMHNLADMDNSISSIASLPQEGSDILPEFVINGVTHQNIQEPRQHPIFNVKQQYLTSSISSINADIELINPPSIFNDITDLCNSLADVPTEAIGTTTSVFEDCLTHVVDNTLVDCTFQDDATEFSDANSVTPIQTDNSSAENTPKKTNKTLSKSMMTKQRRNMARDRYKTYVVAAEKVMQESIEMETKAKEKSNREDEDRDDTEPLTEDYKTVNDHTFTLDDTTYVSPTYTVESPKITPKEKRKMDRSRFETHVLSEAVISALQQPSGKNEARPESKSSSASPSPTRSKLSIRRNFMQKRLENKERFRTQTLSESSFGSPELSSASPPCDTNDIHFLVQKEANLVLKTLRDSKLPQDELLDCETLSLVSNDEDSEHNSGGSINYRTYHKSWGSKQQHLPIISIATNGQRTPEKTEESEVRSKGSEEVFDMKTKTEVSVEPNTPEPVCVDNSASDHSSDEENHEEKAIGRPKIVKPTAEAFDSAEDLDDAENEELVKGIRGRRKPLYSKSNSTNRILPKTIKPAKTMTSNLVKNISSSIKSGTSLKNVVSRQTKISPSKPPVPREVKSSGYGYVKNNANSANCPARSAVNSRTNSQNSSPKSSPKHSAKGTPPLERQGTFTKDDSSGNSSPKASSRLPAPTSKIPSFTSKIARAVTNKTQTNNNNTPGTRLGVRNAVTKSLSSDRTNKTIRVYNRSTSADSREPPKKIQPSSSTQSLKNEPKTQNGAVRKSGIPSPAQRSNSNASLSSNGSAKKNVTSKIASLWKKVEESKAKPPVQDKRIWIQNEKQPEPPKLIRSNTFENKEGVVLRQKPKENDDTTTKRVSRLGSFIIMDENGDGALPTGQNLASVTPVNIG